jgi:hypothetical protein
VAQKYSSDFSALSLSWTILCTLESMNATATDFINLENNMNRKLVVSPSI